MTISGHNVCITLTGLINAGAAGNILHSIANNCPACGVSSTLLFLYSGSILATMLTSVEENTFYANLMKAGNCKIPSIFKKSVTFRENV